jgi:hypothetical protein
VHLLCHIFSHSPLLPTQCEPHNAHPSGSFCECIYCVTFSLIRLSCPPNVNHTMPTQVVHSVSASIVSYFHTVAFLDTATVWSLLFSHHHLVVCLPFVYLLCIVVNIATVNVLTLVQNCLSPSYRCYLYQLHFATTTAMPLFSTSSFCLFATYRHHIVPSVLSSPTTHRHYEQLCLGAVLLACLLP